MTASVGTVHIGIAGMGGYAASVADRILECRQFPDTGIELVAACDPALKQMTERAAKLTAAGVTLSESFDELLADRRVDAVWLPIPIDLHRPFAEQALAAGKHVICEKPAAGSVDDVDAMIAARDRSGRHCLIGFQDVYQPAVHDLKRKLLSGELGKPLHATVIGVWPRPLAYFQRSGWAGRIKRGDTWVLDSPVNNAMAHFVHAALYLLGSTEHAAASPIAVESELYRAADIENYDTATIRATLPGNVTFLVAMTHATSTTIHPQIVITTDRTTVRLQHPNKITYGDGADRVDVPLWEGAPWHVPPAVARYIGGDAGTPVGTLEMARTHTVLINAASEASAIVQVPTAFITRTADQTAVVTDLVPALQRCVERRQLLSETKMVPWAKPGGRLDFPNGYHHFRGPAVGSK